MVSRPIYICYPNERQNPLARTWVHEVKEILEQDPQWTGWALTEWEYDNSCSIPINDVASVISAAPGPCVLLRNVQQKVVSGLRNKLLGRAVVLIGDANDSTDVFASLSEARKLHLVGEPMLPRKHVVALLLIAKLEKHQMWGGNNKGYMWTPDLAKGRGVDERFADQIPEVVNDLLSYNLLAFKTSKGRRKYALEPAQRTEIHRLLRELTFQNKLQAILDRDSRVESARELDTLYEYYGDDS